MNTAELNETIEAIKEYDPIMGDYVKEAIKNPSYFTGRMTKDLFIDYFKTHDNSQTEYSNIYKIAEHLELFELMEKMGAIEEQETEDFFEEDKMKKEYLKS